MVPDLKLVNGAKYPVIGLGTWQSEGDKVRAAVEHAIDIGYRHIDTAFDYQNEDQVGEAINKKIKEGVVRREDLFVTTKLWVTYFDDVKACLELSLKKLKLDYVDLYLIHMPIPFKRTQEWDSWMSLVGPDGKPNSIEYDHLDTWRQLEALVDAGKVRAIGVSNFNSQQIQRILDNCRIPPANLQIECHGYLQQRDLVRFCQERNITVTAYSPLGSPQRPQRQSSEPVLLEEPIVTSLAAKYHKTPAQVLLQNLVQRGLVVIPKSVTPERIAENLAIFDFTLSDEDMDQLATLDRGLRFFTSVPGTNDHPEYPLRIPF